MMTSTRFGLLVLGCIAVGSLHCQEAFAQRGHGGGAMRGGGGMSVPRPSPSMSRPTPSMSRPAPSRSPSMSLPTPNLSMDRPSISWPSAGSLPSRPSTGGNVRPGTGLPNGSNRPGAGIGIAPGGGARPGTLSSGRPSQGQLNDFLDLNRPSTLPSTRPAGGAAGDFLQNNRPPVSNLPTPGTRPAERPGMGERPDIGERPVQRPETRPGLADRPAQLPQRPEVNPPERRPSGVTRPADLRPPFASNLPARVPAAMRPPGYLPPGVRPPGYRPPWYRPPLPGYWPVYGPGYWNRPWRWGWGAYPNNWWAWATAGAVTSWCLGNVARPVYYEYGTNLYYEGDTVIYNQQVVGTPEEYAQQAQAIATDIPKVDQAKIEWLPLGVFALTDNDGDVQDSTLYLQLAISKEGVIAGTFQNTATEKSFEVEGTIDRDSQRAAWGPVGEQWPIMETGIYNLTENEAGALIHFADGQTQQWTMVRMDEPKDKP